MKLVDMIGAVNCQMQAVGFTQGLQSIEDPGIGDPRIFQGGSARPSANILIAIAIS